jgi:hypothetical protein
MPTRVPMVLPEQSIGFFFQSRKSAAGHPYSEQEFSTPLIRSGLQWLQGAAQRRPVTEV